MADVGNSLTAIDYTCSASRPNSLVVTITLSGDMPIPFKNFRVADKSRHK